MGQKIKFEKLSLQNADLIAKSFKDCKYMLSEYSLGYMLSWKKYFKTSFAYVNGQLIIKFFSGKKTCFLLPIGGSSPDFKVFDDIADSLNVTPKFIAVPDKYLTDVSKYFGQANVVSEYDRKWSDYVYDATEFCKFEGKKYHGQRNHVNKFLALYPNYQYIKMQGDEQERTELFAFLDEYAKQYAKPSEIWKDELNSAYMLVENIKKLGLLGAYIKIDGRVVALTVGEIAGETLIIHIEKAFRDYDGVYPTLANKFANEHCVGLKYINREDDSGDLGLRTSKMQYHPIELAHKYYVSIIHPMDKLDDVPALSAGVLTLDKIEEEDAKAYCKMATDEELNKYWGYDYKTDIPIPSAKAFWDDLQFGYKNKKYVSWAVRLDGVFIGEVVLYDRDQQCGAELGCRIISEKWGHGYGKMAYKMVADYLLEAGFDHLRARCYHQNKASEKMILNAGFVKVSTDETFIHFIRSN